MNNHHSLRLSILAALGVTSCAGTSQSPPPGGDGTAVVTIPTATATSAPASTAPDPDDPGILVIAAKTGWVTEPNGNVHRASITSCDPTIDLPACYGTEHAKSCSTDADCTAHPHGKCTSGVGQLGAYCRCTYACANDSECGAGEACVCKGLGRVSSGHSVCAQTKCTTDADCPSKQCGLSVYHNGCSERVTLACRTGNDKCKSDKDCGNIGGQCAVAKEEEGSPAEWACRFKGCAIGRPLVVEGAARAAQPMRRHDWQGNVLVDVELFDLETRNAATNHYAAMAAMEHASVASFGRFALQLLAMGAPAHLLADAHRAALDEIEHARIAYQLASSFGGKNVGPDKLPEAVAKIEFGIEAFVTALVAEGCVGETLGAAEGAECARQANHAALSTALAQIADDEQRHAMLAWATLKWALETFGPSAHDAAEKAFAAAYATYAQDPAELAHAPALGILSAKNLGTIRREVLSTVVEPCAGALGILFQGPDIHA